MIEVKSSKFLIAFWAAIPLALVCFLVYVTLQSGQTRLALWLVATGVGLAALFASGYVELICTDQDIVIRKPYSLIPFSKYNKLHLADIKSVLLWTVKGKYFKFLNHSDSPMFFHKVLWTVNFMGLSQKELRVFATYLHGKGIETSGF